MSKEQELDHEDQSEDAAPEDLEPAAEELSSEKEQLRNDLDEANDQLLRMKAEVQNIRRRAQRDVENAHKFSLDKFVTALLPVVDNMERALGAVDDELREDGAVSEGLELTLKSFIAVLEDFHVTQINPAGQPFDAELHQAVSMISNNEVEPNTVIDVFQKGYTLSGRLVRPAMVTVSNA